MWLGPVQFRPHHKALSAFVWRGGMTSAVAHSEIWAVIVSPAGESWIDTSVAVEATTGESYEESFPQSSIGTSGFPCQGHRGELRLSWVRRGLHPPRPSGLSEQDQQLFKHRQEGFYTLVTRVSYWPDSME